MRIFDRFWQTTVAAAVFISFVLVMFHVKNAPAQQTNLGPFETVVSVPNTAVMAGVAANPARRGLIICNSNATAANNITVAFGSITPTDGVGLIIPGGNVAASCWFSGSATVPGAGGMGAQINFIGHVAGPTSVAVFEF